MELLLVDLSQLRALALPGIKLTPGRVITARVAATGADGRGALSIAGGRIAATLPAGVRTGQELRLVVKEVSADRVLLAVQADAPAPDAEQSAPADEGPGAGGNRGSSASHVLELRYEAERLGSIDLRFEVYAGDLRVLVGMASAGAAASANAAAGELRDALAHATNREVQVSVSATHPPLDLYA
jgi:hypothetical protein